MKSYKGNFRTVQAIKANEDGSLPTEIQVLPVGKWNTLPYGPFEVTLGHVQEMIRNFERGTRKAVPIDVDHDGGKAAGWIEQLIDKGTDGLYAMVRWTTYGQELLQNEIYKLFSPEFSLSYVDPEYSTDHGAVFIAGSLTNRPLFKELKSITASEEGVSNQSGVVLILGQDNMNLEEILKKTNEELTEEERSFLKESAEKLSDEDKVKFGLVEAEAEEKAEEEQAETKEEEEPQVEVKATEGDVITIKASELAELKAKVEAGEKANETLKAKEAEEKIGAFVCNDKGGKILPKDKDAFVDFYRKCSDDQKVVFEGLLKALPEVKIAGELGKDTGTPKTAYEEVNLAVDGKIKAGEAKDYREGLKLVTKQNPDLIRRYEQESAPQK